MLAEILVTVICLGLCCTNIYVISIFIVHRHQLTAKTLLQVSDLFIISPIKFYIWASKLQLMAYLSSHTP